VQYTQRLDEDLTCPALSATRAHVRAGQGGRGFTLSRIAA
jgi:hypothetical protein